MIIDKVYIGGWFQRTTLHLTEIFDFLSFGRSDLDFPKADLESRRFALGLRDITRQNALLEFISARSQLDIGLRIYEDGLIILEKDNPLSLASEFALLENYYDGLLSPAISYIFSKGAPVPKELAQIKTLLPFVLVTKKATAEEVREFFLGLQLEPYSDIETPHVRVYKTAKVILIVSTLAPEKVRQMVEEQIFFREFKAQLHRYLHIHRLVWEEIAAIKEMGKIPGNKVPELRGKLSGYQKTIKLIESRINQMGTYLRTRAKIAADQGTDRFLDQMFAFKFESLEDTLAYVKELWKMTDNYLNSAMELLGGIQAESTKTSISSLQLITTLGVVATIITYLGRDKLPNLTTEGVVFFLILVVVTSFLNQMVSRYFAGKTYTIRKETKGIFKLRPAREEN